MKLGQLRKLIAEEIKVSINEAVSDNLNKLVGFADVFANLPRQMRLDVLRVVQGEFEKVNPDNIAKCLDVLHGLDADLDQALETYVDQHGQAGHDVAAEGADMGVQGHDEGEDEDEETRNHDEDWRMGEGTDAGTAGHDEGEDEDEETRNHDSDWRIGESVESDDEDEDEDEDDTVTEDKHFGGTQYITNPWAEPKSVSKKGVTKKPKNSIGPCED